MKILALHSDFIEIEPKKKAIKQAEDIKKEKIIVKDCLVVLSASQKADEGKEKAVAKRLVNEIKDISEKVGTKNVVLYPYVHLVSDPSNPKSAKEILDLAAKDLKKNYKVTSAPFGWYKAFNLKCKGHPLSELSREFGGESKVEKVERKRPPAVYKVMAASGKITDAKKFKFSKHPLLESFYNYETGNRKTKDLAPPHLKIMHMHDLCDNEPASEFGNLRWYPAGTFIKRQLENYISQKVHAFGGLEVETPIMYSLDDPIISKFLEAFSERQFKVLSGKKKLFLRYAACFGQFMIKKDMPLSYKNLPLKMYELSKYAFRREQRGEAVGLKRACAFTMPDMHTVCKDLKHAKEEFIKQHEFEMDVAKGYGVEYSLVYRMTNEFFQNSKDWLKKMVKIWKKPMLLEILDYSDQYWIVKNNYVYMDNLGRPIETQTVQIDVQNAQRYGIEYIDKTGKQKTPVILHMSPGGIERVLAGILENTVDKKNPVFPLWLSPTQVRICPVSDKFIKDAEKISNQLEKERIRVDIDDRVESIGKKISGAQKEWIPAVIVIGEKEKKAKKLPLRFRESGKIKDMSLAEIAKWVKKECSGKPFRPLPLPNMLSKRPIFS